MTTINWNELGINEITNLFLYGDLVTPANLQDEALTHRASATPIAVTLTNVSSFMTDGPGRLANGGQSLLVNLFMTGAIMPGTGVRQEILVEKLPYDRFFNISQVEYDVTSADFDLRAYIFGHTDFAIAKGAKFIVEADGTRHIENFALLPGEDGFDFDTSPWLNTIDDFFLQNKIDPSGMGHTINMKYDFDSKEAYRLSSMKDYTQTDYLQDIAKNAFYWDPLIGEAKFAIDSSSLTTDLFESGVTKFLDADNKPILYGTDQDQDDRILVRNQEHLLILALITIR
jgi:hypothetical protein